MLEQMRKSSQSLLIYVLFGIIIAVFIVSFGPQSRGATCESSLADDHYAATVSGQTISTNDFNYALRVLEGTRFPPQQAKAMRLKEQLMDKLLERELLANEAKRLGYVVSDEQIDHVIADGRLIALGYERPAPRMMKDGAFNYDAFKNYVQFELGVSPNDFVEQQRKELLAGRMRELFRGSLAVSPNEVKADYLRKGTQVNLEYVRFPATGTDEIEPTDAEIDAYLAANEAKVKALYDERKFIYEKVPKELRLRQIMVKIPDGASADAEKTAEKKAEALLARIKKGESFAKVAKESTDDPAMRARGGDLGWRGQGAANLPTEPEKKLLAAKAGDVVGPLKGSGAFYITKVEGSREGNVPFDAVKRELATEKVRGEKAGAQARAKADAALARAKAEPTKTLKDIFPAPAENKDDKGAPPAQSAAPRAEETGLFSAHGNREGVQIDGIGASNELAKAAFALTTAAPLAGPFEVAGSWIVVRLKERKDPDLAEFEKQKGELMRDAERTKWDQVLTDWTRARCTEVKDGKGIRINREVLRYEDASEPPPYEPCSVPKQFGG
jgi:peptidyl-prolyl cis-trans isomerase D